MIEREGYSSDSDSLNAVMYFYASCKDYGVGRHIQDTQRPLVPPGTENVEHCSLLLSEMDTKNKICASASPLSRSHKGSDPSSQVLRT